MPAKKASTVSKPTYAVMVAESIRALGDRTGSSVQAISKHLRATYKFDPNRPALNKAIKKGVEAGDLIQIKASYKMAKKTSTGATASGKTKKKAPAKKKTTVTKTSTKKSTSKKSSASTKPRKTISKKSSTSSKGRSSTTSSRKATSKRTTTKRTTKSRSK